MLAASASKVSCKGCQGLNVETAKFCNYCGASLGAESASRGAPTSTPSSGKKVCPGCERINELAASFCYDCGTALPKEASVVAVGDPGRLRARLLAGSVDLIVVGLLLLAVEVVALTQTAGTRPVVIDQLGASLQHRMSAMSEQDATIHFVIVCLVYLTATCALWGRSVGQLIAGLRVIRRDGNSPTWGVSLVRAALAMPLAGLLWVPLSQHNRALQDLATGTRVVTTRG